MMPNPGVIVSEGTRFAVTLVEMSGVTVSDTVAEGSTVAAIVLAGIISGTAVVVTDTAELFEAGIVFSGSVVLVTTGIWNPTEVSSRLEMGNTPCQTSL
jgi:hypothetical protein